MYLFHKNVFKCQIIDNLYEESKKLSMQKIISDTLMIYEEKHDFQKYRYCKHIPSRTPADFLRYHFHIQTLV